MAKTPPPQPSLLKYHCVPLTSSPVHFGKEKWCTADRTVLVQLAMTKDESEHPTTSTLPEETGAGIAGLTLKHSPRLKCMLARGMAVSQWMQLPSWDSHFHWCVDNGSWVGALGCGDAPAGDNK